MKTISINENQEDVLKRALGHLKIECEVALDKQDISDIKIINSILKTLKTQSA
jgi:hypothetical protein